MTPEQLEAIAAILRRLNTPSPAVYDDESYVYAQFVPILVDRDLLGFAIDEVGVGNYDFYTATVAQREWWANRPNN